MYILLYLETKPTLYLGSEHTEKVLNQHHNIAVYCHPDWKSITLRCSHHEKLVVVDRHITFVGSIDLCYGRWDTSAHDLLDIYPIHPCTQEHCEDMKESNKCCRWVRQDNKNEIFSNCGKVNWEKPYDDYEYVDRSRIPRIPWHDVACAFPGDAVSDAVNGLPICASDHLLTQVVRLELRNETEITHTRPPKPRIP